MHDKSSHWRERGYNPCNICWTGDLFLWNMHETYYSGSPPCGHLINIEPLYRYLLSSISSCFFMESWIFQVEQNCRLYIKNGFAS